MTANYQQPDRIEQLRRQRLDQLYEELEAIYSQLGQVLSEVDRVRLKRQAAAHEAEIRSLESEMGNRLVAEDQPAVAAQTIQIAKVSSAELESRLRLFETLNACFSLADLQTLCFYMGIEYDDLPGNGRSARLKSLIDYATKRNRLDDLRQQVRRMRPDIPWKDLN